MCLIIKEIGHCYKSSIVSRSKAVIKFLFQSMFKVSKCFQAPTSFRHAKLKHSCRRLGISTKERMKPWSSGDPFLTRNQCGYLSLTQCVILACHVTPLYDTDHMTQALRVCIHHSSRGLYRAGPTL